MVKSVLIASLLFGLSVSALPTKRDDAVKAETLCSPTAAEEACSFLRNHPSKDYLFLLPTECESLAPPEAKLERASVVIIIGEDFKPEVQLKNVCEAANIAERLLSSTSADKTETPSAASEADVKASKASVTTSSASESTSATSEASVTTPGASESTSTASEAPVTTSSASESTSATSEASVTTPGASESTSSASESTSATSEAPVTTPSPSEENHVVE